MARTTVEENAPVTQETIDQCLAWAIAQGDMVNFRFCFFPSSPLRADSPEDIDSPKYDYLRPQDEDDPLYKDALHLVGTVEMHDRVRKELEKNGPAQLMAELVLPLADNALKRGKYTIASQAYELLRIRRRIQELFFEQADAALDADNLAQGVSGYRIAAALEYDYAAFPEPQPAVPNYQERALMLHAEYPRQPENTLGMRPEPQFFEIAVSYLLDQECAGRLEKRSEAQRGAFLDALIRQLDPDWDTFAERCRETRVALEPVLKKFHELDADTDMDPLARDMERKQLDDQLARMPEKLLGRAIDEGEWWQYIKELAYTHPASILFVARLAISQDLEVVIPYYPDTPLVHHLGLGA